MSPNEVLRQLRYQQEKHKNDIVPSFGLRISDMARDAANAIDGLMRRYSWVPVSERLPVKEDGYDWVLVKTRFIYKGNKPDADFGVPHVAELRNGVWYSGPHNAPMEEALGLRVVAWFDIELLSGERTKSETWESDMLF